MEKIKIKELMVPLKGYATVSQDATLYDAVLALEEAQRKIPEGYKHRAILALDQDGNVVGKVSQLDVLRGLEPKYNEIGDVKSLSKWGLTEKFIKGMMEHYALWEKPLDHICNKAADLKVKDVMYKPVEGEIVPQDATIDAGIHQLIVGHHQSLLVTDGEKIVGVLRLTDVFKAVCERIKSCTT